LAEHLLRLSSLDAEARTVVSQTYRLDAQIREVILATQGYKGVLGTFNFTPNGDGLSAVSICEIQQGNQFKLVKVFNVAAK